MFQKIMFISKNKDTKFESNSQLSKFASVFDNVYIQEQRYKI